MLSLMSRCCSCSVRCLCRRILVILLSMVANHARLQSEPGERLPRREKLAYRCCGRGQGRLSQVRTANHAHACLPAPPLRPWLGNVSGSPASRERSGGGAGCSAKGALCLQRTSYEGFFTHLNHKFPQVPPLFVGQGIKQAPISKRTHFLNALDCCCMAPYRVFKSSKLPIVYLLAVLYQAPICYVNPIVSTPGPDVPTEQRRTDDESLLFTNQCGIIARLPVWGGRMGTKINLWRRWEWPIFMPLVVVL